MKMRKLLTSGAIGAAALLAAAPAQAQDFYLGQMLLVGYSFCPQGTLEANGSLQSIAQNTALFSLIGNTYGGDGQTTFAMPDLRGRVPNNWGQGPGLSNYDLGQMGGVESTTLTILNMPQHIHPGWAGAVTLAPTTDDPTGATPADFPSGFPVYNNQNPPAAAMAPGTAVLQPSGGSQPFSNLSPFLTMRYCIVNEGLYPPRP